MLPEGVGVRIKHVEGGLCLLDRVEGNERYVSHCMAGIQLVEEGV